MFITVLWLKRLAFIRNVLLLPAATKLGQGNVFTGICDSVHRGGCLPQEQTPLPPGADTPQSRHPLEQTPPGSRHPPSPEKTPPSELTPPQDQTTPKQTPRSRHPGTKYTPRTKCTSLGLSTPPGLSAPPPGSRLRHTVNERPVCILLEYILVTINVFWSFSNIVTCTVGEVLQFVISCA